MRDADNLNDSERVACIHALRYLPVLYITLVPCSTSPFESTMCCLVPPSQHPTSLMPVTDRSLRPLQLSYPPKSLLQSLKVVKWGTWGQKQNANLYHQRLQSARGRARVARKPCSSVGTAQNFVPNVAGSSLGFAYFLGCRAPFELRSPNVDIEKCWELRNLKFAVHM